MFQFPSFPSCTYVFSTWSQALRLRGSPIRKSADRGLFAAPRGLSQLVTSFVGSWCQGIHLMLFIAWTSFVLFSCLSFANNFVLQWKSFWFAFMFFRLDSFESRFNCSFLPRFLERPFYLTLFLKSQNYLFVFFFIQFPMTFLSAMSFDMTIEDVSSD